MGQGKFAALVLLSACREPTEIVIEITTNEPCSVVVANGIEIQVGSQLVEARVCSDGSPNTVGSIVVVPSGSGDTIAMTVSLAIGNTASSSCASAPGPCVIARRAINYVPHRALHLPVFLDAACAGVTCGTDSTCTHGVCVADRIDTRECVGGVCGEQSLADAGGCAPGDAGPSMVSAGAYCIDSTEVTHGQYADFLQSNPSVLAQPPECSWNTTFTPIVWDVTANASLPIAYVDWCDANAFCHWTGKRLCGKIGGGSLDIADTSATDPSASQWFQACGGSGATAYPYGDTYQAGACNDSTTGAVAPIASFAGCQGGYPGLFDMVGNVEEWQDSCSGTLGASDTCREQGGTYMFVVGMPQQSTRCDFLDKDRRDSVVVDLGIRCCWP